MLFKILIVIVVFALIISGILLLKQSAQKFSLTEEQIKRIKKRNAELDKEEHSQD